VMRLWLVCDDVDTRHDDVDDVEDLLYWKA
jgi:hypothetical protein